MMKVASDLTVRNTSVDHLLHILTCLSQNVLGWGTMRIELIYDVVWICTITHLDTPIKN
jgi:hypothetical protein